MSNLYPGAYHDLSDDEFIRLWQQEYERFVNDPDSDCPSCGVHLMQIHKEGCAEYERIKQEAQTYPQAKATARWGDEPTFVVEE